MRIFEILLLAALLPSFSSLFVARRRKPRWLSYLPILGVVSSRCIC